MDIKGEWWTAPAEGDSGNTVMVTGRKDVAAFRDNPRMRIRVEVDWPYANPGMPDDADADIMATATENLMQEFNRDPVAVLTGIFTGDGHRTWVFYTASTNIFNKKLNKAFGGLPQLPLEITAENDPEWEAYDEMSTFEVN